MDSVRRLLCALFSMSAAGRLLDHTEVNMPEVVGGSIASMASSSTTSAIERNQLPPVERLHRDLQQLQRPSTCDSSRRYLVFQYGFEDDINGFAAMFQFLASALSMAVATNRTLMESVPRPGRGAGVGHDTWLRAPPAVCGGLKHGCYFEHLSSCVYTGDVSSLPILDPSAPLSPSSQATEPVVRVERMASFRGVMGSLTDGSTAPQYWKDSAWCSSWPGLKGSSVPCWQALWFPALQAWLYQPRPEVRTMLPVAQRQGQEDKGLTFDVGVHVRRGDALTLNWRSHAGLDEYSTAVGQAVAGLRAARTQGGPLDTTAGAASWRTFIATDSVSFRTALGDKLAAVVPGMASVSSNAVLMQSVRVLADGTRTADEASVHLESFIRDKEREVQGQGQGLGETLEQSLPARATLPLPELPAVPATAIGGSGADAVVSAAGRPVLLLNGQNTALVGRRDWPAAGVGAIASLDDWCAALPRPGPCDGPNTTAAAESEAYQLTAGVIADVWGLAHASAIVGTCLSQVSRAAADLQLALGHAVVPAMALDMVACAAFPHDISILTPWRGLQQG